MKFCSHEDERFPDTEFYRREDGVLMHRPQDGPEHPAGREISDPPSNGPLRQEPPE